LTSLLHKLLFKLWIYRSSHQPLHTIPDFTALEVYVSYIGEININLL